MNIIRKVNKIPVNKNVVLFLENLDNLKTDILNDDEIKYIKIEKDKNKKELIAFNRLDRWSRNVFMMIS